MCVWQCLFVIGDVLVKRPRSQLLFKAQPIRINTSIKVFQPNLFFKLMCIYRYYYPTCHYWMDNKCFYNVDWRLGPKPHTKRIIFYYYYYYYFPVQQFYPDNKNKREGEREIWFFWASDLYKTYSKIFRLFTNRHHELRKLIEAREPFERNRAATWQDGVSLFCCFVRGYANSRW